MSALQFGTSGLRGLVSDMTPDVCARYTQAFIRHLEASGDISMRAILLGRDLRESSAAIAEACAAGARSIVARCRRPHWRWLRRGAACRRS